MSSKVIRVSDELAKEIERISNKNHIKAVEASREIAREIQKKKGGKSTYEIRF